MLGYEENPTICGSLVIKEPIHGSNFWGICNNLSCIGVDYTKLLHYSCDVMTDITCVKTIYQANLYLNLRGGSEMMWDGDVIGLLPTLERAHKYELIGWLLAILIPVLQSCHLHVSLGAIIYLELFADYKKLCMYGQERAMRRIKVVRILICTKHSTDIEYLFFKGDQAIVAGSDTFL
jgi:hypothetical protein